MGTTTHYAIPFPAGSDPPAGAPQMQALAEKVDASVWANDVAADQRLDALEARATALETRKPIVSRLAFSPQFVSSGTGTFDWLTMPSFAAKAARLYKIELWGVTSAGANGGLISISMVDGSTSLVEPGGSVGTYSYGSASGFGLWSPATDKSQVMSIKVYAATAGMKVERGYAMVTDTGPV